MVRGGSRTHQGRASSRESLRQRLLPVRELIGAFPGKSRGSVHRAPRPGETRNRQLRTRHTGLAAAGPGPRPFQAGDAGGRTVHRPGSHLLAPGTLLGRLCVGAAGIGAGGPQEPDRRGAGGSTPLGALGSDFAGVLWPFQKPHRADRPGPPSSHPQTRRGRPVRMARWRREEQLRGWPWSPRGQPGPRVTLETWEAGEAPCLPCLPLLRFGLKIR